jgi:hypothetical protein
MKKEQARAGVKFQGYKKLFLVSIVRGREEDVKNDTSML